MPTKTAAPKAPKTKSAASATTPDGQVKMLRLNTIRKHRGIEELPRFCQIVQLDNIRFREDVRPHASTSQ